MTGVKFAAAGAAAAAAGAGINRDGTQERVILGDKKFQELTGVKFGMIICTRIGGSCLGLLQTKTMSKFCRTLTKW